MRRGAARSGAVAVAVCCVHGLTACLWAQPSPAQPSPAQPVAQPVGSRLAATQSARAARRRRKLSQSQSLASSPGDNSQGSPAQTPPSDS